MQSNINTFPDRLKKNNLDIILGNYSNEEKLLIIYYNKYKNNQSFSFEHLCSIINDFTKVPTLQMILRQRSNNAWNIKNLNDRIINFIIDRLLLD